jgi:predicted amidohydrolase
LTEPFIAAVAAMRAVHDKAANLKRYREFVDEAARAGARLLILPEASLQGFLFHADRCFDPEEMRYHWEHAEPVPGPSTEVISAWAADLEMWIVFGMMERSGDPAVPVLHNSAVLVGPAGVAGVYRKVHQPSEEVFLYQPGGDWPVFPTPLCRIGMMICYDQCFPEAARELTLRGAEILVVPTAWAKSDQGSDDRYDFFARARAAENGRWLLQSNQAGVAPTESYTYLGRSRIIDPSGIVVAESAAGTEALLVASVEPLIFDPARTRAGWYLQHRTPDTYRALRGSGDWP